MREKKSIKARAADELRELITLSVYWVFFLCAFALYRALITSEVLDRTVYFFRFGWSVVTGVAIAHMISIGDRLKLGEKQNYPRAIPATIEQVAIYTPFVVALLVLERVVEGFLHGKSARETLAMLAALGWKEVAARTLVIIVAMVPFFALREIARQTGYNRAKDILLGRRKVPAEREPVDP